MNLYLILKSTLTAIADAIREKLDSTDDMTPLEMPALIRSIQTGGTSYELHTVTDIVITASTNPYILLNSYIEECSQWCYFPTSESPSAASVARGWCFKSGAGDYRPSNLLGKTGSNAGNTALTNNVSAPSQFTVNDISASSTRLRGNVNFIPRGTYTLKFYGIAKEV